jgi:hypothetical protein
VGAVVPGGTTDCFDLQIKQFHVIYSNVSFQQMRKLRQKKIKLYETKVSWLVRGRADRVVLSLGLKCFYI